MSEDPEEQRIGELLARITRGEASEADREEVRLHAEHRPELLEAAARSAEIGALGKGWLSRVEHDARIAELERGPGIRIVRGAGVGMLLGSLALAAFAPMLASAMAIAGTGVLLTSFVRARFQEHRLDPYKDVLR